jgi:hypothetical protein
MSHYTRVAKPHDCWFCSYTNPSYLSECDNCKAAITPTRDDTKRIIEWTVFTFSSDATVSERSSFSQFNEAMKILDMQERVVIRLGDQQLQRYILVRYTRQNTSYSYRVNNEDGYMTVTARWAEATDQQRELLFRFVNKNLENTKGELTLLKVF